MEVKYENLVVKKLAGDISPDEEIQLNDWIEHSIENREIFIAYKKTWEKSQLDWKMDDSEEVYSKITDQLDLRDDRKETKTVLRKSFRVWKIAAMVALLLGMSFGFYVLQIEHGDQIGLLSDRVVKSTPKGKKTQIRLPDGTMVKLNSNSYLEYPKNFGDERRIKLIGEAFFDVVRDPSRPFIVESENLNVRVLGTSFNIKAYPYDAVYSVAVKSGLVSVSDQSKSKNTVITELKANEVVDYMHNTGEFKAYEIRDDQFFAWKDGILVFQKADFDEIIERLEKWYGVEFELQGKHPIASGFSGRYENASLQHVLQGISFANNFTFTIEGNKVIIK
ncbi:FecR domain-containing protein [Reichenbachiella sp. MALMAid0571]|uniref:FecR family protein n=1 Tax=Reichenbachiella sp. MALMAid0571 TaxID=3143939 RepID=UPI0032DE8955